MFAVLPFSFLGCSKSNNEKDSKIFVGIAIYQKLDDNLNWSKFTAKPNAINNIISTENNKITLDEEPELLFYVYSQNEITTLTTDSDFISNTTKDTVLIKDDKISRYGARGIKRKVKKEILNQLDKQKVYKV